ncbi:PH domain-containing protein [Sediminibacterium sp. TEGAF015]|uniref:PH domain-containing protein n=1 Tax=Sediminibacterium sp. TEGAF015 TaxID=575378 RepID=UPI00220C4CDD|nr:PH domain-containing protein [Sediminibacterium sp. TEGAF015]BDQ11405.1 hypothetical protein TEGAF0_06220 [Sediminibacterium sp. TEGAF015]
MQQQLAQIAIVVDDYDKAIAFYTQKLQFELIEDTQLSETKRWVKVKPRGKGYCSLLLAKAANEEQSSRIGNQTGGRVFLFLHTDNFQRDYQNLLDNNITIIREPCKESYGTVAVFQDIFGNLWDLIEPISFTNQTIAISEVPQYANSLLQPVEFTYKKVLYIGWSVFFVIAIAIAIPLFFWIDALQKNWIIFGTIGVIVLWLFIIIGLIEIGFKNLAWALREKDIICRKGWIFQDTHIIPFGKVQNCVIQTGPIGRKFGLASIKLMTAASHLGDISIHGLKKETAEKLKDWMMDKMKKNESN